MRSKEEIEYQMWQAMANGCQLDSDLREDSEGAVTDCTHIAISYAKEVAIEYRKWLSQKPYNPQDGSEWAWGISDEEKFEIFKQENNIK